MSNEPGRSDDPVAPARVLVLIPTYDERDSLPLIVERLRRSVPEADLLVVDDSSPDGTGDVADQIATRDRHVQVLHRPRKEGLGAAYLAGFEWGLERGYDTLVEIDADGSHPAETLPQMLAAARSADVVIGSRYVPGGDVENWPRSRELLSRGGNLYIRLLLGMPVNDATAGFRVYRADAVRTMGLDDVESMGYCFQTDLTWRAVRAGLRVVEVPILFVERQTGRSKMSPAVARESLLRITRWGVRHRLEQARALTGRTRALVSR